MPSTFPHFEKVKHLWRLLIIDTGYVPEGLVLGHEDSWEIPGSTVGAGVPHAGRDSEAEF